MITYHLVAHEVWEAQRGQPAYTPEAFEQDGFVHCTDGEAEVIATANRYYQGDGRPYVVLSIETDRLAAPVRYEDAAHLYPHVYGPIETGAVTAVRGVDRDSAGAFLRIASAPHGPSVDR